MSNTKRSSNCEHSSLSIKPGNIVECRDCGALIDDSDQAGNDEEGQCQTTS